MAALQSAVSSNVFWIENTQVSVQSPKGTYKPISAPTKYDPHTADNEYTGVPSSITGFISEPVSEIEMSTVRE